MVTQIARMVQRIDSAANWTSGDPILRAGELAVESDTLRLKMGDGVTAWSALDYVLQDQVDAATAAQTAAEAAAADAEASVGGPGVAEYLAATRKMRTFGEQLAKRGSERCSVGVLGDSIPEGVSTTAPAYLTRALALTQKQMRLRLGITGGLGHLPMNFVSGLLSDPTSTSGTAATESEGIWGAGGKALLMPGTTGSPNERAFPNTEVDRVRIYFGKTSFLGGQSKVLFDGVDVTASGTLGGNGTSGASTANLQHSTAAPHKGGFYWDSGPITLAARTVSVRSTANGSNAVHTGGEFYNGDFGKGLVFYDATHSGYKVTDFIAAAMDPARQEWLTQAWDAALIFLGTNGWSTISAVDHATHMATLIGQLKAANPAMTIILVHGWRPGTCPPATWAAYGDVLRALAAADPQVVFLDLSALWPALLQDGSLNNGLMVEATDPVHPNGAGNQRLADILTAFLLSGGAPSAAA